MALLAPMPSASVNVATSVKAGEPFSWRMREFQIAAELVEPLREAHVAVSPSAKCRHRLFEARDIAEPAERQLARGRRIHAALDELARAHLDVQGELFVDLALERHAPQPRTQ